MISKVFKCIGFAMLSFSVSYAFDISISQDMGAYAITSVIKSQKTKEVASKPKPQKFIGFLYLDDVSGKVGGKEHHYRVYISSKKTKVDKNTYQVYVSYVDKDVYENMLKTNEKIYKNIKKAEDIANSTVPLVGSTILARVNCKTKQIIEMAGQVNMIYYAKKKSPKLNKEIYEMACEKGKLPLAN